MGRYSNIEVLKSKDGERYFKNNTYPLIPYSDNDIYVITTAGDRLDLSETPERSPGSGASMTCGWASANEGAAKRRRDKRNIMKIGGRSG
jgi:hypothetical protein